METKGLAVLILKLTALSLLISSMFVKKKNNKIQTLYLSILFASVAEIFDN
jgi:hypothetical protein